MNESFVKKSIYLRVISFILDGGDQQKEILRLKRRFLNDHSQSRNYFAKRETQKKKIREVCIHFKRIILFTQGKQPNDLPFMNEDIQLFEITLSEKNRRNQDPKELWA